MPGAFPAEFLDLMAGKFQLLADATRLSILSALMAGEKSVGQVVEETGRSQANVSKHLKLLASAGLVVRRKEGLQVFYHICDPVVERVCRLVCETILRDFEAKGKRHQDLQRTWAGKQDEP